MKSLGAWRGWIAAAVVLASVAAMADDPPSRVARLQYISGAVSLQPGGVNDWVEGVINRPLTTADRLWTDKDARAELDLGSAALRANAETSLTLTNLTDNTMQVELDQGTLDLRVRRLYEGEIYEIDTPNLAFTIMKAGDYRFDVDANGDTTVVTVWRGQGIATGEGRSVKVKGDHYALFSGGTSLAHEMRDDPERDGFDDWCRVRDRREEYSESARYVSPDVIGAEDLDDYGTWRVVPRYGAVWMPAVAPGWAPYHYGHWAWVEPWGWTWVDDEPWGFAPCHYGRWVYYEGAWGWVPGPRVVRPVYAPALVAWVGGGGVNVSIAIGQQPTVGWFPLGYGEPYVPPYEGSRNYFRQVNVSNTRITNITQVTNNYYVTNNVNSNNTTINRTTVINNTNVNHNNVHIRYANERVPGAVTAVPTTVLAGSQPVARAAVRVPVREWKDARVAMAPPVAPSRNSVLGARAGAPAAAPPARVISRQVVMNRPAPPKPIPFSVKQEALEHRPGRPLDRDTEKALRTRIARQQVNRPGTMAEQETFGSRPGNGRPVSNSPQQNMQMRPPENASGLHAVPRPPEQGNRQQPGFQSFGSPRAEPRAVPQPPQRVVPRPSEQGNRQQPGFQSFGSSRAEPRAVPQPPQRVVPRPPEQGNRQQPGFQSFGSSRAEPRAVPQPPQRVVSRPSEQGNRPQSGFQPFNSRRGTQGQGAAEVNRGEAQPRAPQFDRARQEKTPAARPAVESARPNPAPPRVERPASRVQAAPIAREAQPRAESGPPPQQRKNDSKDNPKQDKQH